MTRGRRGVGGVAECCTHWFLRRILKKFVDRHSNEVLAQRWIPRHVVYKEMSWLHRFSKHESREVFRLMQNLMDGIRFGQRGLCIHRRYLSRENLDAPPVRLRKLSSWTGGDA